MIDWLLEKNLIPDFLIRQRIRKLNLLRIKSETLNHESGAKERLIEELKTLPVAIETQAANDQHYEVPPDFFEICLGKHLKYSCCYWDKNAETLDEAEAKMLRMTCERAEIEDGNDILELGCGWGAISLWMAESYPDKPLRGLCMKDQ